ncbi:hypothetical protein LBMAG18_06110 [Alphaproteobacteria bacterium]|nr:hypothetical protein LBMAG18_06110 [Alphaproteobacteria bacterium]
MQDNQKKLNQLKRYRDSSIVGVLFSTLGLIVGVSMVATQFFAGVIGSFAISFLIVGPSAFLTFSLWALSFTNKNYQEQLSKCQANNQNDNQSSNNQRSNKDHVISSRDNNASSKHATSSSSSTGNDHNTNHSPRSPTASDLRGQKPITVAP